MPRYHNIRSIACFLYIMVDGFHPLVGRLVFSAASRSSVWGIFTFQSVRRSPRLPSGLMTCTQLAIRDSATPIEVVRRHLGDQPVHINHRSGDRVRREIPALYSWNRIDISRGLVIFIVVVVVGAIGHCGHFNSLGKSMTKWLYRTGISAENTSQTSPIFSCLYLYSMMEPTLTSGKENTFSENFLLTFWS